MKKLFVTCLGVVLIVFGVSSTALSVEWQLTFDTDRNHALDNNLCRAAIRLHRVLLKIKSQSL